ncbi:hypothetical protein A8C46_00130 [Ligilactobacillus salivarius]|nr:hypothetical protein A8C38_00510 [Ligilactobacillus salivarius]PAY43626.1 hypothetical protein A8C39_00690 [Ligilactobacillus salivarius]PAY49440.1 hypothetical protein A8C42_00835 [Ligilactobacillus salivarius]PAY54790.1 hypothetical protein A8C41_06630 [Ligilactobacillus salivarius]PAY58014.1 hypothetical protein A8C46_00130 [Ligilactobacillus salivarius]
MWFNKKQKRVCGGDCYGGNKGVLPERGKDTAPAPKPQPKTLGKELYEITKRADDEIRQEAMREAKVLFYSLQIKDRFIEEAKKGNVIYAIPLKEFEELAKKNNLHSDTRILIDSMWDVLDPMDIYVNRKIIDKEEVVAFQWHE